jgi:ABC-2 type transport system ATP-binding protein
MPIIEIEEVTKKFGEKLALNRVSFSVLEGDSFALLGPNGAGKTTLVRIVSTLLRPTSGRVTVRGVEIFDDPQEVKMAIGVVSHNPFLYEDLSARENLQFYADLYSRRDSRVDVLLEKVGLSSNADDAVKTFSRGMKQRLSIARALVHDPPILILDEPTAGLDVEGKAVFYDMVKELNEEGKTILLTTHYLPEAEDLCEKVCILDMGEVRACGMLDEIKGEKSLEETFIRLTGGGV